MNPDQANQTHGAGGPSDTRAALLIGADRARMPRKTQEAP